MSSPSQNRLCFPARFAGTLVFPSVTWEGASSTEAGQDGGLPWSAHGGRDARMDGIGKLTAIPGHCLQGWETWSTTYPRYGAGGGDVQT